MGRGVNRITLLGNLGQDPDVRYSQAGNAIATISVATSRTWKDKDGELQEKTEWHRVKLFGRMGEVAGEYLKKGSQVYLEGRMEYGSYEKDGVTHYTADVVAEEMRLLGGSRAESGDGPAPRGAPRGGGGRGVASRESAPRGDYGSRPEPAPRDADPFPDDDIPF